MVWLIHIANFAASYIECILAFLFCARFLKVEQPFRKKIIIFALFFAALTIIKDFLFGYTLFSSLALMLALILVACIYYKHSFFATALCFCIYFIVVLSIDFITLSAGNALMVDIMSEGNYRIFAMAISKSTLIIVVSLLIGKKSRYTIFSAPHSFLLSLISLPIILITLAMLSFLTQQSKPSDTNFIAFAFSVLLSAIFFGIFLLLSQLSKAKLQEQQLVISDLQSRHLSELIGAHNRELEAWKENIHDFKNQLFAIETLIDSDDKEQIKAHIKRVGAQTGLPHFIETGNLAVDAILSEKAYTAREKGIDFYVDLWLNCKLPISNLDLCSILGNLADNAIEACEKCEQKVIEITGTCKNGLRLVIRNSCNENALHPGFPTTKPDTRLHGIGLQSVKSICDRTGGSVMAKHIEGYFVVQALFHN